VDRSNEKVKKAIKKRGGQAIISEKTEKSKEGGVRGDQEDRNFNQTPRKRQGLGLFGRMVGLNWRQSAPTGLRALRWGWCFEKAYLTGKGTAWDNQGEARGNS